VTNIHTHGLHVTPGVNSGRGTESDNVQVRLMSKDDWALRKKVGGPECGTLIPHEYVGHVDYEFILGNVQRAEMQRAGRPPQNDPPGTFWYHRTPTDRPTTRSPPAWRVSSSSKVTSTTRSTWR
jgi:hypothetical protein